MSLFGGLSLAALPLAKLCVCGVIKLMKDDPGLDDVPTGEAVEIVHGLLTGRSTDPLISFCRNLARDLEAYADRELGGPEHVRSILANAEAALAGHGLSRGELVDLLARAADSSVAEQAADLVLGRVSFWLEDVEDTCRILVRLFYARYLANDARMQALQPTMLIQLLRTQAEHGRKLDRLLVLAEARIGPATEAKVADPRVTALEAQNQQLLQIIADQARAGLATVAGAEKETGLRIEQERVEGALARASRGERSEALAILGEVAASRAARADRARREAAAERQQAAETYRQLGALAFLASTGQALDAYRQAADLDPGDSWTWIFINRLEAQLGRLDRAEEAAVRARRAAEEAGNERDVAVAEHEIGAIRVARGDLTGAKLAFQAYHDTVAGLAEADLGNAGWQRDLSVSWEKLGDVRVAQGDLAGALQAYEAGRAIRERLAGTDPGNAGWQRDLSVSWEKLGNVRVAQGDLAGALQAFEAGRVIAERLAGSDPGNAGWQRDLSVSWNKLGDVRRAQGDLSGALQAYEAGRAIRERLAGTDPGNAEWQRDLSVSWERLAGVREREGDRAGAQAAWHAALAVSEPLAERLPGHIPIRTTPVIHLAGLARTLDPGGTDAAAEARGLYDRALRLLRPLAEAGLLDAQRQGWIEWLEQERATLPPQ